MANLTSKQRKFIDAYLGQANGNATEAARLAGYQGNPDALRVEGSRLLTNANISTEIERVLTEYAMPKEEILARLTDQARGAAECLTIISPHVAGIDFEKLREANKLHLIKSLKYTDKGQLIVEFYDAQSALEKLGRYYRLFNRKEESEVEENVKVWIGLTPDDL